MGRRVINSKSFKMVSYIRNVDNKEDKKNGNRNNNISILHLWLMTMTAIAAIFTSDNFVTIVTTAAATAAPIVNSNNIINNNINGNKYTTHVETAAADYTGVGGGNAEIDSGGADSDSETSLGSLDAETTLDTGGEVLVPKAFPLTPQEPTCEQLRAMWIFSKRQSRAAEMTNEIPTYRDPFTYNVWEPYYSRTRSLGAVRIVPPYGERSRSPVFGRIINREPMLPQGISLLDHQRQRHPGRSESSAMGNFGIGDNGARIYGAESKPGTARRPTKYRYIGANANGGTTVNAIIPSSGTLTVIGGGTSAPIAVQGSFQKLKELIWTERAKELTQQRHAEELAARAAVLKEIANGQNIQSSLYNKLQPATSHKSESHLMDKNRSPDPDGYHRHLMNDGRISIPSGQMKTHMGKDDNKNSDNERQRQQTSAKNNERGIAMGKSRSYVTAAVAHKFHKSYGVGDVEHSGRLLLPTSIANSRYSISGSGTGLGTNTNFRRATIYAADVDNGHNEDGNDDHVNPNSDREWERDREERLIGIQRTYPVRPSHFRERNRSLFKQNSKNDYFQRNLRRVNDDNTGQMMMMMRNYYDNNADRGFQNRLQQRYHNFKHDDVNICRSNGDQVTNINTGGNSAGVFDGQPLLRMVMIITPDSFVDNNNKVQNDDVGIVGNNLNYFNANVDGKQQKQQHQEQQQQQKLMRFFNNIYY